MIKQVPFTEETVKKIMPVGNIITMRCVGTDIVIDGLVTAHITRDGLFVVLVGQKAFLLQELMNWEYQDKDSWKPMYMEVEE